MGLGREFDLLSLSVSFLMFLDTFDLLFNLVIYCQERSFLNTVNTYHISFNSSSIVKTVRPSNVLNTYNLLFSLNIYRRSSQIQAETRTTTVALILPINLFPHEPLSLEAVISDNLMTPSIITMHAL